MWVWLGLVRQTSSSCYIPLVCRVSQRVIKFPVRKISFYDHRHNHASSISCAQSAYFSGRKFQQTHTQENIDLYLRMLVCIDYTYCLAPHDIPWLLQVVLMNYPESRYCALAWILSSVCVSLQNCQKKKSLFYPCTLRSMSSKSKISGLRLNMHLQQSTKLNKTVFNFVHYFGNKFFRLFS